MQEPVQYHRNKMHKFPFWLIVKFYWWRCTVISIIWFVYVSHIGPNSPVNSI